MNSLGRGNLRKRWPTSAIVISLVLALLVGLMGVFGVVGMVTVNRLNDRIDELDNQLVAAESQISDLEADLAAAGETGGSAADNLLEDLLGGLLGGEGGDLGDLFGGENGGLGDLLGGLGGADLSACLTSTPGAIEISDTDLETQIDDIAAAVTNLRDLKFPADVEPIFVSPEEMGERVRDLAGEALPDELVEFDTRLWVALAMLDPGFDLFETQLDLLDSAVAGYYDPDTRDLVVATSSADSSLGPTDQVTLAHELIHALTDSQLNFPDIIDDPLADPERARAIQALIEGDATLGMQQFSLGALDLMDQFGMILDPRIAASQLDLEDVPYLLSNGLQLPYLEGMRFACSLYDEGGWQAVDAAYDAPPMTTAEILFPELYEADWQPETPEPAGAPGDGWSELRTVGFGAVDLLNLFSAPGDDPGAALSDVRERVRSWGGGTATVWARGEESAVLLNLVDGGEGTSSLCESMSDWVPAAFPRASPEGGEENLVAQADGATLVISCAGDSVRVAISPDLATSLSILA